MKSYKEGDTISRQMAIDEITEYGSSDNVYMSVGELKRRLEQLPSTQPEQILSDDDKETIRIHLGAFKEKLCNQHRWDEAEEYERLIERLTNTPSAQPEQQWIPWDGGRFPDDSGTYIVTAYDGAQERVTFAKYQNRLKRWELTGARAYWRVIAWMPLPEPYKGESDE